MTMMRDSWYVIFSLLSLVIGLAWLLFVTFAQGVSGQSPAQLAAHVIAAESRLLAPP